MKKLNRISVNEYTESFYNFFASTSVNRNWLARGKDGEFETSYIQNWRLVLFILNRINVYLKIVYLVLLFQGYLTEDELDFYTKYGIVIWVVTTFVAIYSDYYYMSKFPCFEALCAFWNIQSEIYYLLSMERREEFRKRLDAGARFRINFHLTMATFAMIGLGVQYVMDPKGVLFTGYLVQNEPFICTVLLGFIDQFFLYATWAQAVSVILVQVLSYHELTVVFSILAEEVNELSDKQKAFLALNRNNSAMKARRKRLVIADGLQDLEGQANSQKGNTHEEFEPTTGIESMDLLTDNSRYTIDLIFMEYRKLQIITNRMKHIMSYVLLSTIIIYFAQISSDVFVGIRLIRDGAASEVGFYVSDCCTSMLYWFVSLGSLSKMDEAHEEFHFSLKSYFKTDYRGRMYHLKKYMSMSRIATWLGPCAFTSSTVCTCMMTLVNYYILAAMW